MTDTNYKNKQNFPTPLYEKHEQRKKSESELADSKHQLD